MTWSVQVEVEKNGDFFFCNFSFSVLFFFKIYDWGRLPHESSLFLLLLNTRTRIDEFSLFFFFYFGSEKWEKVNFTWHPNGTVSYQPTKTFFFNREMSYGDESDLVQTLNIPLVVSFYPYIINVWFCFIKRRKTSLHIMLLFCVLSIFSPTSWFSSYQSAADQMKYAVKLTRLALGSMLGVLNQETFTVRSVREFMWGYNDSLFKLAKDVMPPENVVPHDLFGLFVGVCFTF